MPTSVLATIIEGPSNVTYIPGLTPLPIELICNCTGAIFWKVNKKSYFLSFLTDGALAGHSRTGSNILVNSPVNNTKYICISPAYDPAMNSVYSDPAYIVIAGKTFSHVYIHIWQLFVYIYYTFYGRDQRESVLLFPYCTLQRHKCAVFAQVGENTAHLPNIVNLDK